MVDKLTLIAFRRIFNLLSLEDQESFLSPYTNEIEMLKRNLDDAIDVGEISIVKCKCGKSTYFHMNSVQNCRIKEYGKDKGFWIDYDSDIKYGFEGVCDQCI